MPIGIERRTVECHLRTVPQDIPVPFFAFGAPGEIILCTALDHPHTGPDPAITAIHQHQPTATRATRAIIIQLRTPIDIQHTDPRPRQVIPRKARFAPRLIVRITVLLVPDTGPIHQRKPEYTPVADIRGLEGSAVIRQDVAHPRNVVESVAAEDTPRGVILQAVLGDALAGSVGEDVPQGAVQAIAAVVRLVAALHRGKYADAI